MTQKQRQSWVIIASFVAALLLTLLPLPDVLAAARPAWMAMTLIYWCLALPGRIGVGGAWAAGLLLDAAQGALLGQHALSFALIAYSATRLHLGIRQLPLLQQAAAVAVLILFLDQMLGFWIKGMSQQAPWSWSYWLATPASMMIWPAMYLTLRHMRRRYRLA
ncbi:MAG: rod shape-determining protein MreD [Gammaproteobacteria bacterium]|nr:MAG: rod shape-determining protein MreD [Gammaproteobacteria bacterium]